MKNVVIKIAADIQDALSGINKVTDAAKGMGASFKNVGAGIAGFGRNMAALTTVPIVAGLGLAVKEALNFDKEMSSAARAVGLTKQETAAFQKEILKMAPQLGMMPESFAQVVTEAAKLGIAKNEVIGFAKTISEFTMITDSNAVENAKTFSAIKTITGMTNAELKDLMATTNKLDDSIGSSSTEIANFTKEVVGTGKVLGINAGKLAAFGATMQSIGIPTSRATNAMEDMMTKLAAPQVLSDKARAAFGDIGLSADALGKVMAKDATQGIMTFLNAINKTAGTDKQKALGAVAQIIGTNYNGIILRLAQSTGKLNEALGYAADKSGNMSKYTQEVEQKLSGASGQMAIFKSQLSAAAIQIGGVLIPALTQILQRINPVIEGFGRFAEANPHLVQLGVGIAIVVAAIAPLVIGLGMVVSAVGTVIGAVGAAIPIIGTIAAVIGTVVGAIVSAPGLIAVGIAAAVAAVVAGVYAIYKNWDWLKSTTVGVLTGIKNWIGANWQQVGQFMISPITWALGQFANAYGSFRQAGWGMINAFYEGLKSVIMAPVDLVKQMVANVRAYLPGSDAKIGPLSDLTASGASLPATFSTGMNSNVAPVSQAASNIGNTALPRTTRAPIMAASGGGGTTITLHFEPVVNVNSNGNDGRKIVETLRPFAREMLDMLGGSSSRLSRTQNLT